MSKTPTSSGTVKPKEALKHKKQQESNKNLLIWGLIGVGVLVNAVIIYQNYVQIHHPITNLGNGKFVAEYQSTIKNHSKASQDVASELKSHRNQITNLDIQFGLNQFNEEHMGFLSQGLIYLDQVQNVKISLSHNEIGDKGAVTLCTVFASLPSLTTLHLGFDAMTLSNIALTECMNILGNTKSIKNLTVSLIHNKIKDEGAKALLDGFSELKKKLTTLNLILISNDFTSEVGKHFEEFLPTLEKVTSIYLSLYANRIGAEGAHHLSKGLQTQGQLRNLNLDLFFNNITETGTQSLSKALTHLNQLDSLKLNLEFNYINNEGGEYLSAALKKLTQLKTLHINVATKNFGYNGFKAITDGLQSLVNLEELFIHCGVNKIGPQGIEDLKLVYSRLTKLKKVRLNYYENSLGDPNAIRVNQMFDALQNVEELDLNFNFNNLLQYGIAQILKGVQKLPKLRKLELDVGQSEVNDEDIQEIFTELDKAGSKIPNIEFGFLNTAITPEVAEQITAKYANHISIKVSVNSTVSKDYLEERKKKQEEQEKQKKEGEAKKQQ